LDLVNFLVVPRTSPIDSKIEAYKQVLDRIPKVNKENIRYLIKFLAKIVENSDKTKMTASNMGICFGVSLLSSNGPLANNKNNKTENSIDMATATNVFDFLLTNHKVLFDEDVDFSAAIGNSSSKKINYNTLPKASGSSFGKLSDSPFRLINTDENIHEDSISELQNPSALTASSPFQRGSTLFANSANVTNTNNINRTITKKSNIDSEFSASNNSINSLGSVSNFNSNKSMSSPSQNSTADPGSLSPRRERAKKMAPAPPPAVRNPGSSDPGSSYYVTEIQTSPPKIPTTAPAFSAQLSGSSPNNSSNTASIQQTSDQSNDVSKQPPLFPKLSSSK